MCVPPIGVPPSAGWPRTCTGPGFALAGRVGAWGGSGGEVWVVWCWLTVGWYTVTCGCMSPHHPLMQIAPFRWFPPLSRMWVAAVLALLVGDALPQFLPPFLSPPPPSPLSSFSQQLTGAGWCCCPPDRMGRLLPGRCSRQIVCRGSGCVGWGNWGGETASLWPWFSGCCPRPPPSTDGMFAPTAQSKVFL